MWVFDDESVGLVKEPFVAGTDVIIDKVLELKNIQDADKGFKLLFSAGEFPNYDIVFDWVREGDGGNWYQSNTLGMEGWLCPALMQYFDSAPKIIYARFEQKLS